MPMNAVKVNPFKPNSPVPTGLFVGRRRELERIQSHLRQTRAGNPSNFMITGERGIGKSSLLLFAKFLADGSIVMDHERLKFLVVDTDLDAKTTQMGLVKKLELGLRRSLAVSEPAREVWKRVWEFMQRVEIQGSRISTKEDVQLDEVVMEEFCYSLAETCERVCGVAADGKELKTGHNGILFLLDEADNASAELDLGSMLKLMSERLQRKSCNNVMFGLAGLPALRDVLHGSHPSSLRLFEELPLGRLSDGEVNQVLDLCLESASEQAKQEIGLTQRAREQLVFFAEGYPHFIQQFGYSAFSVDTDYEIDEDDVLQGAFGTRGALEQIGDRYYRDDFYNRIQKDSYRQVLRIMADGLDEWIRKREIRERFSGKDSDLSNAIYALRERNIIQSKEGVRGVYRLRHKGFALWIKLHTTDPQELQREVREPEARSDKAAL